MKTKLFTITSLLLASTFFSCLFSQTSGTINFDNSSNWIQGSGLLTSYRIDHQYIQDNWIFTGGPALRQTTTAQDGFPGAFGAFSWRLNSPAGTEFYIISNSEGPVEEFGFSVRRWDNNPSPNFIVEYSNNGGQSYTSTGVTIDNTFLNNSSDWSLFNFVVPSPTTTLPGQFIIRVRRTAISERIMIDDFTYTIGASTSGSLTSLRNPDCSRVLNTMNQQVYARIIGADEYIFEVTNQGTGQQTILNKSTRDFNLTEIANPVYNTNYQIRVQAIVAGQPEPIGTPCVITSPTALSQLRTVDCGKQLISFAHLSYANITVADQWEFEATNLSTMDVEAVVKQDRSFSLNDLTDPQTDVSYSVRVRVVQDGIQQPYGNSCEIFAPVTEQLSPIVVNPLEFEGLTEDELIAFKKSIEQNIIDNKDLVVSYYPNPFSSNGFNIQVEGVYDDLSSAELLIIDLTGKIVYKEVASLNEVLNKQYGHNLQPGIYTVSLIQDTDIFITRVIKQ